MIAVPTFEVGRKYSLKIGGLYCSICFSSQELLLQSTSSLTKMEKEEFHQSRLPIRTKDLLEAIDAEWSLIR